MKTLILLISFILLVTFCYSQNGSVKRHGTHVDVIGELYINGVLLNVAGSFSHVATYTSNGTFDVPTGVTKVLVIVTGGGGGGGYGYAGFVDDNGYGGGGGGAGGYCEYLDTISDFLNITITIGAGGAGATTFADGTDGGTSSFGSRCQSTGGEGGYWILSAEAGRGGSGGIGSGGYCNSTLGDGGRLGFRLTSSDQYESGSDGINGGSGGSCVYVGGGGGGGGIGGGYGATTYAGGNAKANSGAGGGGGSGWRTGGATSYQNGGNGAAGKIIIFY